MRQKPKYQPTHTDLLTVMENTAMYLGQINVLVDLVRDNIESTSSETLQGPFDPWKTMQDRLSALLGIVYTTLAGTARVLAETAEDGAGNDRHAEAEAPK